MKKSAYLLFIFAIFVLVGGIVGAKFAGSHASIYAGLVSAVLLAVSGILLWRKKRSGIVLGIVVTLFLDGFFTWRFIQKGTFFPAGLFSLLSLLVLILLVSFVRAEHNRR